VTETDKQRFWIK